MIYIIITSYGEPKATTRAIKAFLNQEIPDKYKIIVADPFPEIEEIILNDFKAYPQVEYFEDPDEGKSKALNIIFKMIYSENKNDIIISTDGDVFVSKNTVKEIINKFKDPKIGIVTGKVVSMNSKKNMFGYWSHLLFSNMNLIKEKLDCKEFFEVSGYLFAMRNGVIKKFPLDACEDNVLSIIFFNKGYKIGFVPKAEVYVLNPQNFKDWVTQKKRNIKGHMALGEISSLKKVSRRNTLFQEAFRGLKMLGYPKNLKEFYWTVVLLFARLYLWVSVIFDKKKYSDGWRVNETDSTKPMD